MPTRSGVSPRGHRPGPDADALAGLDRERSSRFHRLTDHSEWDGFDGSRRMSEAVGSSPSDGNNGAEPAGSSKLICQALQHPRCPSASAGIP
jgi:hypothetical protein